MADLLSVRSLRYSEAEAGRCSRGMALWNTKRKLRPRSGPEEMFRSQSGRCYGEVTGKEKAEVGAPAFGC